MSPPEKNPSASTPKPSIILVQKGSPFKLLCEHLLSKEFEVTSFSKAGSAMKYIDSAPKVDALVTTLDLEDQFGGCNVARSFHRTCPQVPIILFTSQSDQDHRVQLLASIPQLVIVRKPFQIFSLVKRIKRELRRPSER